MGFMEFLEQKFACPVNISNDWTMGIWMHDAMLPPAVPLPVKNLSIEVPAPQLWPPGYWLNQNSLTTNVFHIHDKGVQSVLGAGKAGWIVLDEHDQGVLLPHITIPVWLNILYLVIIPFSNREIAFTASTVIFNEKAVGCACLYPVFPMMTCGDPCSSPIFAFPLTNMPNTLKVGISGLDIVIGVAMIAVSVAVDLIFEYFPFKKLFYKTMKKFGTKKMRQIATKQLRKMAAKELREKMMKQFSKEAKKKLKHEAEEKIAKEAKEKAAKNIEKKMAEKMKHEATEKLAKEAKEKAAKEVKEKTAEKLKHEATEKLAKEAKEKAAKEIKEKTAEKLKHEATEKLAKEAKEKAAKEVKEKAAEKMKHEAEEKLAKEAKEKAAKNAAESLGKQTLEEAEKEATEEAWKEVREQIKDKMLPSVEGIAKSGAKGLSNFGVSQYTNNPTFKMDSGTSPYLKVGVEWSKSDSWKESANILIYKPEHSTKGWEHMLLGEKL